MKKLLIKVPGSTANLGPGFDSIGLAVNRYLIIEAEPSENWEFIYRTPGFESIPTNEDNLIYKAILYTANESGAAQLPLRAYKLVIDCELPLASGLGSSAAAIVAGIELADTLLHLSLSNVEKARLASNFEGHPDNVSASLYGGLIIASHDEEETIVVPTGIPKMDLIIMIPTHKLMTSESREVLPTSLSFQDGTRGSSVANVLIAALLNGDLNIAGQMMKQDLFHQPYRSEIIPDLEKVTQFAEENGIEGVALSGAGPSIMCYTAAGKGDQAFEQLQAAFPTYDCQRLSPAKDGATVTVLKGSYS